MGVRRADEVVEQQPVDEPRDVLLPHRRRPEPPQGCDEINGPRSAIGLVLVPRVHAPGLAEVFLVNARKAGGCRCAVVPGDDDRRLVVPDLVLTPVSYTHLTLPTKRIV